MLLSPRNTNRKLTNRSVAFGASHFSHGSIARRTESSFSSQWEAPLDDPVVKCIGFLLVIAAWFLVCVTLPFSLIFCLRVMKEYERAVLFRLGKLKPGGAQGPGIIFMLPCVDRMRKVDLRLVTFNVPPQEILSKDSVTVSVDAVIYFRVSGPTISVTNVYDAFYSTKLLAQTSLRNILGTKTLSEMLLERDHIAEITGKVLDEGTDPWGIKVERVEMKDIRLPEQLMRVMAAEAEATREARAKIVAAEGEQKSSRALTEAAVLLNKNPTALQLRYLQTLNSIAAEHNSTIIFPLVVDSISPFRAMSQVSSWKSKETTDAMGAGESLDLQTHVPLLGTREQSPIHSSSKTSAFSSPMPIIEDIDDEITITENDLASL